MTLSRPGPFELLAVGPTGGRLHRSGAGDEANDRQDTGGEMIQFIIHWLSV